MKRLANGKVVSCCKGTNSLLYAVIFVALFSSCSLSRQISRQAAAILLQDSAIVNGHVGISIYEPGEKRYLYNYNADKYFIPASNTKFFTLYAGMKYLGDSLAGARINETVDQVSIYGTGDPTFLHPGFTFQPVFDYLRSVKGKKVLLIENENFNKIGALKSFGKGWSWDDYDQPYMTERSFFPVYGNLVRFSLDSNGQLKVSPNFFNEHHWWNQEDTSHFSVLREPAGNVFSVDGAQLKNKPVSIPFKTRESYRVGGYSTNITAALLSDTLKFPVYQATTGVQFKRYRAIYSQPTDSLLKPMMFNSDNFFAEQTLLMASNELLGYMDDESMIDTLLKKAFSDIPQEPRWVDGSGLSRYNLFTPQSFIYILNKLQQEFGMKRLQVILPTGGQGTLKNYFNSDSNFIYAKTGSMSNQFSLCGYLTTKKNRQLIFSVLVNNEMSNARDVRRAVERFIKFIRNKY